MALDGFTDHGFPGTISDSLAWTRLQRAFGVSNAFMYFSHMRPTIVTGATRTVKITAGESAAHGVWSDMEEDDQIALANQASGKRYDCIVAERVQGAGPGTTGSRLAVVPSSSRSIPELTKDPMGVWQTAIGLAEVTAGGGGSTITDLVDLRVVREHGGVFTIFDDLALSLVDHPGVMVHNATTKKTWARVYTPAGARRWMPISTSDDPMPPRAGWFTDYAPQTVGERSNTTRVYTLTIPAKPFHRYVQVRCLYDVAVDKNSFWYARMLVKSPSEPNSIHAGTIFASERIFTSAEGTQNKSGTLTGGIVVHAGEVRQISVWVERDSGGNCTIIDGTGKFMDVNWTEVSENEW